MGDTVGRTAHDEARRAVMVRPRPFLARRTHLLGFLMYAMSAAYLALQVLRFEVPLASSVSLGPFWSMAITLVVAPILLVPLYALAVALRERRDRRRQARALDLLRGDSELYAALHDRRETLLRQWEAR